MQKRNRAALRPSGAYSAMIESAPSAGRRRHARPRCHGCPAHVTAQSRDICRESYRRPGFLLLEFSEKSLRCIRFVWTSYWFRAGIVLFPISQKHFLQQVCDQSDRDLNTYRVVGAADEMRNFEDLLHDAEEQLDLQASLIEARRRPPAGASRSLVRIHSFPPVSIVTTISRTAAWASGYDEFGLTRRAKTQSGRL